MNSILYMSCLKTSSDRQEQIFVTLVFQWEAWLEPSTKITICKPPS